ncbi:MAG: UPF0246 protein [Leptospiraceae bacterium]|nr:MAG: UPF0246 protein [Leptospiraceae bacterium]
MIIVISPAKTLKRLNIPYLDQIKKQFKEPVYFKKSLELVSVLKTLSSKELEKLLDVSPNIAELNYERYKNFPEKLIFDESYPAIFLFYGDVYKGFEFNSYEIKDLEFIQNHLRILSGLYGILKPLDLIYPYRLEMGTDLSKYKSFSVPNLYEFWKEDITDFLNKELKKHKNSYLINLASNEYFSVIDLERLNFPVINIYFQEKRNGGYKTIALNAKRARGKMANWIIRNQIDEPEKLKQFNVDNYKFSKEKSDEFNWYFLKN